MRNPSNPFYNQNGYSNAHGNAHGNGGYYNNNNMDSPMSAHSQQHSYETMTSGSDENGKSTNPSSLNSSFDHLHQMRKPEPPPHENQYSNDINFAPVSPQQLYSQYGMVNGNAHHANGNTHVRDYDPYTGSSGSNGNYSAPRPPAKDLHSAPVNNPRQPIKLNAPGSQPAAQPKRQSWLKRTFSRRN